MCCVGRRATPEETFPNTACLRSVSSCPQVRFTVKTPRRPAGPVFVSVQPVQSGGAEALVSLRDHKHTVKLTLSQRTLIRSCIRNTHTQKTHTHTLNRPTTCSHPSPHIEPRDKKSYDWGDGADEGLTGHELFGFSRRFVSWDVRRPSAGLESEKQPQIPHGSRKRGINRRKKGGHWPYNPTDVDP